MGTWITRLDSLEAFPRGAVLRVAVKDAIDVAGVPTTVGSPAIAARAAPAEADAACVTALRAHPGVVVVGKANLQPLCLGTSGVNPAFGTPRNPTRAERVPGGSSSGSAAAVGADEADIGLGTDTGGSVRIPAACCGVVGLKTTYGRIPLDGVWPLAPSLDTVGILARDVRGVIRGMTALDPSFSLGASTPDAPIIIIGRIRVPGLGVDPQIDTAVDAAVRSIASGVHDVWLPSWHRAISSTDAILSAEAWASNRHLLRDLAMENDASGSASTLHRLKYGANVSANRLASARAFRGRWLSELSALLRLYSVLALPTLVTEPCRLDDLDRSPSNALCSPINLAGLPAIAVPLPRGASLQLVGGPGSEALLCATAAAVEASTSVTESPR